MVSGINSGNSYDLTQDSLDSQDDEEVMEAEANKLRQELAKKEVMSFSSFSA